jgi:hypothetical protein
MNNRNSFLKYVAANYKFKKRYEKICRTIHCSVQVRTNKLGERFENNLIKLRLRGYIYTKIAADLDIRNSAVRQRCHMLKKRGKLE